ncbi:hypothetical protein MKW94_012495 [Papaver nudicaule]|uniref:Glabrous enhancer-binding protein-like DBD domain-containing protein n=1 Tax=Papaver nudicaule TaxID=74823 RepID=A0AA41SLF7_PAPNU|nr:hypothetical protein [Papaver nudicaule]
MTLENPPSASSSSEKEKEREVEEEEEVSSKEEEEESDESEEDGDDDEETEKSRFSVVPNSKPKSKDADEENSDNDSDSDEQNLTEKEPKHTSIPAKRPAAKGQVEAEKSKKRRKNGEDAEKKPARVWTDEGEIVLLKGMADYYINKGKRPNSDSNGFYEFIKGSINNDVSKDQLASKIRHARLRYIQNEAKEKSGEVLSFSKPHFEKCYELSKTIWCGETQQQKNGKKKQGKDGEGETTGADVSTNGKSKSKKLKTSNRLETTVEKEGEGISKDGEGETTGADVATNGKSKSKSKKLQTSNRLKATVEKEGGISKDGEGETTEADGVTNGKSKTKKLQTSNRLKATVEKEGGGVGLSDLLKFKEQMIKPPPGLESFLNKGAFQLVEPSRGKAFEKKWKDLQVEEAELFLKRIDLVREYSSMVIEALNSPTS